MSYNGRIESVFLEFAGGAVSADTAAGATTLPVSFPVDFDENGGSFTRIPAADGTTDTAVYSYTGVDIDGETLAIPGSSGSTIPNFLTGDSVGFASSKGSWAQVAGATAWATGDSQDGDNGFLQLTSGATGTLPTAGSVSNANYATTLACVPGDTIYVSGWFKAATIGRTCVVGCVFFNSSGTVLGGGATFGTGVTSNTTGWVQATATLTAPANAAYVRAQVQVQGTGNSEVHKFDNAWLSKGVPTASSGLPVAFSAGDVLRVSPESTEARALVRLSDTDDMPAVECRIAHALRPLLATGVRDPGTGESVIVDEDEQGLVVTDLFGQDPVIVGARFLATGDAGEMLIYSGEPTIGNLIASVSAVDGLDSAGNYYLAGNVSYEFDTSNGLYVAAQVNAGTVAFYTAGTMQGPSNPWMIGPKIDGWSVQTGTLAVTGPVAFGSPFQVLDPVAGTIEGWHSLGNLGVTGISMTNSRYRLTPDGEVEFDFVGSATAAVTAGSQAYPNTLPTQYRPAVDREYVVGCGPSNTGRVLIHATGVVTFTYPALSNLNVIGAGFHMPRD